jgi:hypothetical protein
MKAKSIKGNSTEEIKSALELSMADGYKPTLAFLFLPLKQDRKAITALFNQEGIRFFGATTGGEITDGEISGELFPSCCQPYLMMA